jgi:hypothetical protein
VNPFAWFLSLLSATFAGVAGLDMGSLGHGLSAGVVVGGLMPFVGALAQIVAAVIAGAWSLWSIRFLWRWFTTDEYL